jgi:transposase
MGVIIGMDPHKRPATIEVIDEQAAVLAAGRYGTDTAGYAEMLAAARRFAGRVWAVEGCDGIGRHLAHRLVHDGEPVFDVPPKLSAQVRVFATGNGRKTDEAGAHSVALAALRAPGLVQVRAPGGPGGDGHAGRPPRRAGPGPHPGRRPAAPAAAGTAARRG